MWGFVLHYVNVPSVEKILKNLDVSRTSRTDQISMNFFKYGAPKIVLDLANIINMSIKLDTFSSQCKITKIKLVLKKGIKTEIKNYRPISLLSLISKVIEKSINNQTQGYLQRLELLYSYQSDFRANDSADTFLSQLTDLTLNGVENGKHMGMILIDFQKTFHTLDHKTFIIQNEVSRFFR